MPNPLPRSPSMIPVPPPRASASSRVPHVDGSLDEAFTTPCLFGFSGFLVGRPGLESMSFGSHPTQRGRPLNAASAVNSFHARVKLLSFIALSYPLLLVRLRRLLSPALTGGAFFSIGLVSSDNLFACLAVDKFGSIVLLDRGPAPARHCLPAFKVFVEILVMKDGAIWAQDGKTIAAESLHAAGGEWSRPSRPSHLRLWLEFPCDNGHAKKLKFG